MRRRPTAKRPIVDIARRCSRFYAHRAASVLHVLFSGAYDHVLPAVPIYLRLLTGDREPSLVEWVLAGGPREDRRGLL